MALSKPKNSKLSKEILRHSAELKKKKRIGSFVIFWIMIVIVFSGAGYLLYCPALTITKVSVEGARVMDSNYISDYIVQAISGKFWYVFPQRNDLLYPARGLEVGLLKKFPRLAEATIDLADRNSLVVSVKERDFDTVWCRDSEVTELIASSTESELTDNDCYFADVHGMVFASAPTFVGSVFVELHGGLAGNPIGTSPLTESAYKIASGFAKILPNVFNKTANSQYRFLAINILDENDFSAIVVDSSRTGDNVWQIFIDGDDDANTLAGNLYTILESPAFRKDMLDHKNNLASIDLRYGKKVFYKFKN